MLFSGRPPQYPHLVTFLDHQRRNPKRGKGQGIPYGAIVSGVIIAALLVGDKIPLVKWLAMAVLIGVAGWFVYQSTQERPNKVDTETRLRREAQESGTLMRAALQHRRLHRDLGEPSLILLDEAGRQWARVQESLSHPFWGSDSLPVHYESVKEQSQRAAESGMNEVLALFRPLMPDAHVRRPVMDYVGEAIEGLAKKPGEADQTLPPMYGLARDLVEQMRTMADELEKITSSAALDPATFQQHGAAPALEGAIHDLRNLRQAEQELQQAINSPPPVDRSRFEGQ